MLFQTCIGLDVRSDRFNVVAVRSGIRENRVVAHTSVAFDSQLQTVDKTRLIGDVTAELIRKHHLDDFEVAVMLPRELFIVRELRLPLSVKENLRATLGYEMQKYVPLPLSDIYFDFLIVEEDSPENLLRVTLFVMRKTDMDAYLELKTVIGEQICGVEIMPVAISDYLADRFGNRFTDHSFGLIRSGCQDGEIWVYHCGRLAFAKKVTADGSGDAVTKNAALSRRIAESVASYSDANAGLTWFYYHDSDAESMIIPISDQAKVALKRLEDQDVGLPSNDYLPAYALASRYLKGRPPQVNLLPREQRKKPNRSAYYIMLSLTVLAILAALSWGGSIWIKQRLVSRQLDDTIRQLQQDVIHVEKLTEKKDDLEKRLVRISTLYQNRSSVLAILEELSDKIPVSVWIQEFKYQQGNVQISGYADSATDLVQIIETSPLFDNVVFLSAITRTKDGKEQFRIGMGIQNK